MGGIQYNRKGIIGACGPISKDIDKSLNIDIRRCIR